MASEPPILDDKANVAQRINWVMQQVDYVQKQQPDFSKPAAERLAYSIVTHDSVTELLRPLIVKAGLIYYPVDMNYRQDGNRTEAQFSVRFENIADRNDSLDVATLGFGVDKQDKGPGKALSYGVKFALLKAFGLATGEDPDLNQGSEADHRSTLDQRIDDLETAIAGSPDTVALTALINSEPTKQIMDAAQARNVGEYSRLRTAMSDRLKALKKEEAPAPATPAAPDVAAQTGAASGEDADLGGKA